MHPLSDNGVGASDLMAGKQNLRKVTVLSKAILLVLRISYFDENQTFSKQDFSAVGFLDLLKTLKTQGQKSLFPY